MKKNIFSRIIVKCVKVLICYLLMRTNFSSRPSKGKTIDNLLALMKALKEDH